MRFLMMVKADGDYEDCETDAKKQQGVWQYCSEPSGEALEAFMKEYPYYDAPEPIGGYAGQQ